MTRRFLVAAVVAATLWCSSCGSGDPTINPGNAAPPKVFVEWDATGATNTTPGYKKELVAVIRHIAVEYGEVFAVLLDGQPITTSSVMSRNFGEPPPEGVGDPSLANKAVAEGFAHNFIASFAAPEIVHGSGQLQGLLLAANTPGVSEIMLWSDGIVNEPNDGFDLSSASVAEVEAEITRWKPKLAGLKHRTVVVVGVGHGVHTVSAVERAHRLFQALVEGENGGRLLWVQSLAQR